METKYYIVKFAILRNNFWYGVGEKIELTESEAEELKDSLVPDPVVIPEIPFTYEVSDVVPDPQDESLPSSIEAETQEEAPSGSKKSRAK